MNKIKNIYFSILKPQKILLVIGFLAMLVYLGFLSQQVLIQYNDPANFLKFSSFMVQAGMLFFMILSFQIARIHKLSRHIYSLKDQPFLKVNIYSISLIALLSLCFTLLIVILLNAYYFSIEAQNSFYYESTLFLINNWLLPFLIISLLGYIVGLKSTNKLSLTFLFIIWALVSPANQHFIGSLLSETHLSALLPFIRGINLSISEMNTTYHPLWGFELRWYKKGLALIFLVFLCLWTMHLESKKNHTHIISLLLAATFFLYGLIPYAPSLMPYDNIEKLIADEQIYSKTQQKPDLKMFNYNIKNMNVEVLHRENFLIKAQTHFENIKQTKIAFSLYHRFTIMEILDSNGRELPFKQQGDYTIVSLPNKKKDAANLTITYKSNGSFANPINKSWAYLPSTFNWLPANTAANSHFSVDGQLLSSKLHYDETSYKLTFKGNKAENLITNLHSTEPGIYTGNANGITLIIGNLASSRLDNREVYYPKSWFLYEDSLKEYLNVFESKLSKYNDLNKTDYFIPNKIIFLPSTNLNDDFIFFSSYKDENQLILHIDPVPLTQKAPIKAYIPFQIDSIFSINAQKVTSSTEFAALMQTSNRTSKLIGDNNQRQQELYKNYDSIAERINSKVIK